MKTSEKVKQQLERLGITITGSRWAWTAAIGLAFLWGSSIHDAKGGAPIPAPSAPPIELQRWMGGIRDVPPVIARALPAKLPPKLPAPLKQQKTKGCDPSLGERHLNGGCWMATDVPPPCPERKLWEQDEKCWRPVPMTTREPTTGEPLVPDGVAAPE